MWPKAQDWVRVWATIMPPAARHRAGPPAACGQGLLIKGRRKERCKEVGVPSGHPMHTSPIIHCECFLSLSSDTAISACRHLLLSFFQASFVFFLRAEDWVIRCCFTLVLRLLRLMIMWSRFIKTSKFLMLKKQRCNAMLWLTWNRDLWPFQPHRHGWFD